MLSDKMYSKLLDNPKTNDIADMEITKKGGELDSCWNSCEADVQYFADMNNHSLSDSRKAKFFVLADYLTCVPYGTTGYDKLEEILKSKGAGKTVADIRFEKLTEIMGQDLTSLPKEQVDYIKDYFYKYNDDTINLHDLTDVTRLICRVHHECEANYKAKDYRNVEEIKETMMSFVDALADYPEVQNTISADSILKEIKKPKLSEADMSFLEESIGKTTIPSVKQP